jgi:hypothetical protein
LEAFWQVRLVDLVDAPAADKTHGKRHRYVFTKLRALEVPFRKIVFFDLDVVVRRSPAELFEIPAPAGMYHGPWAERGSARHGKTLSAEAFSKGGCVNAGLLRLDPSPGAAARRQLVETMLAEVRELGEESSSYLPEQYYMVQKLPDWHHIGVAWNCEVNPLYYVEASQPRKDSLYKSGWDKVGTAEAQWETSRWDAWTDQEQNEWWASQSWTDAEWEEWWQGWDRWDNNWWDDKPDIDGVHGRYREELRAAEMPWDWWELGASQEELSSEVAMFHFSGTFLEPWWYLHLSRWPAETAKARLQRQFHEHDSRGMIALALSDWLGALQELRDKFRRASSPDQASHLEAVIGGLLSTVDYWWDFYPEPRELSDDDKVTEEFGKTKGDQGEVGITQALHPTGAGMVNAEEAQDKPGAAVLGRGKGRTTTRPQSGGANERIARGARIQSLPQATAAAKGRPTEGFRTYSLRAGGARTPNKASGDIEPARQKGRWSITNQATGEIELVKRRRRWSSTRFFDDSGMSMAQR